MTINHRLMIRDSSAIPLTIDISRQKAITALLFNTSTLSLSEQAIELASLAQIDGVLFIGGDLPIVAGIGVSGAPSGTADEECAQASLDSIQNN